MGKRPTCGGLETETKPLWTTTREAMGKKYTIGLWPDDAVLGDEGSPYGVRMDHRNHAIPINAKIPCDGRDEYLLHELLHRVSTEFHVGLKEHQVGQVSAALYAFLRGFGLWQPFPWPDKEEETDA